MRTRHVERTGWDLAEVGFGSWQLGADWGPVSDSDAIATLHAALDGGVNFIDTADVYGNGRSEQLIARALKGRGGTRPVVATKLGRRSNPHIAASYTRENMTRYVERSLRNLDIDALDLVQVHSPPTEVFYQPETFEALEGLVREGKIRRYGASVEKVEEGIKALEYPGLASVQIIFNMFRQRPAELFFKLAKERGVAVIVRVPLASGLLSGKFNAATTIRPERPPHLQPPRRSVRRRRDVRRRALRDRSGGGRRAPAAGAGRREHGAVRAALDPHA